MVRDAEDAGALRRAHARLYHPVQARPALVARERTLPMGEQTYVMAIINLTEDSFSGDGIGSDLDEAVRRAVAAIEEGADIVDIGAESARSDVPVRDAFEEGELLGRAIERIARETGAIISADTYKPSVAEMALQAGAHVLNDIGGFKQSTVTAEAAARYGAALVLNYAPRGPKNRPDAPPQHDDLIGEHLAFLRERATMAIAAGVSPRSLIADPGIAFGKSHDEDLEVLRRLGEFRSLGLPILVAASRKHFIGSVIGLGPRERDEATAAVTALNVTYGADIVRVHDVRTTVRVVRMADAIVRARPGDYGATAESWPWASGAQPIPGTRIGETGSDGRR
jgi:dihydropteroate synthase